MQLGGRTPAPDHRRFAAGAMPRLLQRRGIHEHVRRQAGRRLVCRPRRRYPSDPRPQGRAAGARHRRFQLLVRFFEALRRGQASTRGQLPSGSQLLLMPPERRDGQTTLAKHGKAVAAERTWSPGEFLRGDTAMRRRKEVRWKRIGLPHSVMA